MVGVAQLVRAPDCGSGGRGFETRHPPHTDYVLVPPINEVSSEASRARDGWPFTLWQPGGDAPVISPTFPLAWHPSCPVAASCVRT